MFCVRSSVSVIRAITEMSIRGQIGDLSTFMSDLFWLSLVSYGRAN